MRARKNQRKQSSFVASNNEPQFVHRVVTRRGKSHNDVTIVALGTTPYSLEKYYVVSFVCVPHTHQHHTLSHPTWCSHVSFARCGIFRVPFLAMGHSDECHERKNRGGVVVDSGPNRYRLPLPYGHKSGTGTKKAKQHSHIGSSITKQTKKKEKKTATLSSSSSLVPWEPWFLKLDPPETNITPRDFHDAL
jgi:hypothetical protein